MLSGCGSLAQWLERRSHKPLVAGSNPAGSTIFYTLIINEFELKQPHSHIPFFSVVFPCFLTGFTLRKVKLKYNTLLEVNQAQKNDTEKSKEASFGTTPALFYGNHVGKTYHKKMP